jgi:hypothetical protein
LLAVLTKGHQPIAQKEHGVNVGAVSNDIINRGAPTAKFIAGRSMHSVSKSRYGRREVQNQSSGIRPARNLKKSSGESSLIFNRLKEGSR